MKTSTIQFITTDAGVHVAASEIVTITPNPACGGYAVTFKTLPPAHANDLAGLGEVRLASAGTSAYHDGELRSVYAWRLCAFSNVTHPIWGLKPVAFSEGALRSLNPA